MKNHLRKENVQAVRRVESFEGETPSNRKQNSEFDCRVDFFFPAAVNPDQIQANWFSLLQSREKLRGIIKTIKGKRTLVILQEVPFTYTINNTEASFTNDDQKRLPFARSKADFERGPLYDLQINRYHDGYAVSLAFSLEVFSLSEIRDLVSYLFFGQYARRSAPNALDKGPNPNDAVEAVLPVFEETSNLNSERFEFELEPELVQGVKDLSASLHVSNEEIYLAIWCILLARYSDAENLRFGIHSAMLTKGTKELILRCSGVGPFSQLISQINGSKHYRDLSKRDLVVLLFFHSAPFNGRLLGIEFNSPISKFDIHTYQAEGGLRIQICSNRSHSYIKNILGHWQRLLKQVIKHPQEDVVKFSLLTSQDRHRMERNNVPQSNDLGPFPDVVEKIAKKYSDKTAIRYGNQTVTYDGLMFKVKTFQQVLLKKSVCPGDIVGVMFERNPDMPATILAIAKMGAVYLPLDPNGPLQRLSKIVSITRPKAIIVSPDSRQTVIDILSETGIESDLVCHNLSEDEIDHQKIHHVSPIDLRQTANLFYTSGTTGIPKGVLVSHLGVANHLRAKINICGLNQDCVVAQNATHTFDISHWQMIAPLMVGGEVVIYPDDVAKDPFELLSALVKDRVTTLELVPVLIQEINRILETDPRSIPSLKLMVSNAEALSTSDCIKWMKHFPRTTVVNTYGATECSDDVTHQVMRTPPDEEIKYVSVGKPIPGAGVFVLDRMQRPMPTGCEGEVCITGICVGQGYFREQELTKTAFVKSDLEYHGNCFYYRTGDTGYVKENGEIVILGRIDDQVKVNGHRVELGEVEAALNKSALFEQFAVLLETDRKRNGQILCFHVNSKTLKTDDMRAALSRYLPEYMIPAGFYQIESIPVTDNGKVDRNKLREVASKSLKTDQSRPENDQEKAIYRIWSEVLEKHDFGVDTDFFRLGGNSIKTVKLKYLIQNRLGIEIPLALIFEARTIRNLSRKLAGLDQTESLKINLTKAHKSSSYPLSPYQYGLWFLNQMLPEDTAYNMVEVYKLKPDFDAVAFLAALNKLVKRHFILRANIVTLKGHARLIEYARPPYSWDQIFETLPPELTIQDVIGQELNHIFNLENDRLVRFRIAENASGEHAFVINMHHIITDARSWQVLKNELWELYQNGGERPENDFAELPLDYPDFVHWHTHWLTSKEAQHSRQYWMEELSAVDLWLDLSHWYTRSETSIGCFQVREQPIDAPLMQEHRNLCREAGVTEFCGIFSIYALFLHKITNQTDFVIPTPLSCRQMVNMEDNLGLFVNMLPIHVVIDKTCSFGDFVRQMQKKISNALENAFVPLQEIVEQKKKARTEAQKAAFSTTFAMNTEEFGPDDFFDPLEQLCESNAISRFDLSMSFNQKNDRYFVRFDYDQRLFSAVTVKRWLNLFSEVFLNLIRLAEKPLALSCLLNEEIAQSTTPQIEVDFPPTNVMELFSQMARKQPEAVAIVFRDECMTYHELLIRANHLAIQLRNAFQTKPRKAADDEKIVVICVRQGFLLPVAILGTLMAGCAYLPVDPSTPPKRIEYFINNSGSEMAVADSSTIDQMKDFVSEVAIPVKQMPDEAWEKTFLQPSSKLAYVYYTSGSTGNPKGVEIEHSALANFIQGFVHQFGQSIGQRVFNLTSVGFDIYGLELFLPLVTGGCCILCSKEMLLDPPKLNNYLKNTKPSLVQATPSTWTMLLPYLDGVLKESTVITGGEALTDHLADKLTNLADNVLNAYGPTEATIWVSVTTVRKNEPVNISALLPNITAVILDKDLQRVPLGMEGELYIGGDCLARGYLNREQQTREAFIPNPFASDKDKAEGKNLRLYKTGDVVKWLEQGMLKYIGRKDSQIKLRGHRIDLKEIEIVIEKHPQVKQAAVVSRTAEKEEQQILVFIVPKQKGSCGAKTIKDYLGERLPDYMLPSFYFFEDSLPLLTSGKIDSNRLISEAAKKLNRNRVSDTPTNRLQLKLLDCWKKVLGTDDVELTDNFFDRGGHSITAVALSSSIFDTLDIRVRVAEVFRYPSVERMAENIQNLSKDIYNPSPLIPLNDVIKNQDPLFLIHPQGGGVFCYYHLARSLNGKLHCIGIQAIGYDSKSDNPCRSIDEMTDRYLRDILDVPNISSYRLAGWSFGGALGVEIARKLEKSGGQVEFVGLFDAEPLNTNGNREIALNDLDLRRWFASVYVDRLPPGWQRLNMDQLNDLLIKGLREKNIISKPAGLKELNHIVDFMRLNIEVANTFEFTSAINQDITLFHVEQKPKYETRELVEPALWKGYTNGSVKLYPIRGNHHSIFDKVNVRTLHDTVLSAIEKKYVSSGV